MKKVLVVAAHPNDEIIGCGASILRHTGRNNDVHISYATIGNVPNNVPDPEDYREIRETEIRELGKVLCIPAENQYLLYEPVHCINEDDLCHKLLRIVRSIQPQICYIPHAGESDIYHALVSRTALDAIMQARSKWFRQVGDTSQYLEPVEVILAYEISTPLTGEPNYVEWFTETEIDEKISLLKSYGSQQWLDYGHRIKGLAAFRGGHFGIYAEAFQILKLNSKLF